MSLSQSSRSFYVAISGLDTLSSGSAGCETQFWPTLGAYEPCRLLNQLEAQGPNGGKPETVGALATVGARLRAGLDLELAHEVVGDRGQQLPGAVRVPVVRRHGCEGDQLPEEYPTH